ncbi:replication-relaxation family protein [Pseudonocardia eucalypti]|uniref:Replication-relaxation family protein n=2 Tax=Pseudonocardia eucalypti TaxID=648755 RepID=A0ABP9Q7W2_9PSEU|nr:hypothetical protein [Pseudonocardia eucalypti]
MAVLRSLASFRLMTGRQLQQLHITSDQPATSARRGRAVLKRLTELGAVVRLERQIGGEHGGSESLIYTLSGLGQSVLALDADSDVHVPRGRMIWDTKPAFQNHLLAIADLYVELHALDAQGQLELLQFETEPAAWRWFAGPAGGRQAVKPDAFVALGVGDFEQQAFVEIDRGTESRPTIARKCRRYVDYWQSGQEQQRSGVFPKVWWLTSKPRWAARIADVIASLPAAHQPLFGVGLAAQGAELLRRLDDAGGQP